MKIVCDATNNTPETIANGELHARFVPETPLDIAALVAARVRELAADPDVIAVEADPEDATKIIVTRRMAPQLEALAMPATVRFELPLPVADPGDDGFQG